VKINHPIAELFSKDKKPIHIAFFNLLFIKLLSNQLFSFICKMPEWDLNDGNVDDLHQPTGIEVAFMTVLSNAQPPQSPCN
jgi:hypothetical protein